MTTARRQELGTILNASQSIATNPSVTQRHPATGTYWHYLQSYACLAIPDHVNQAETTDGETWVTNYGFIFPEQARDTTPQQAVYIVPLYSEDKEKGEKWKIGLNQRSVGSYWSPDHEIRLNMEVPETPMFRAIALLHEAGHAWHAVQEHRMYAPPAIRPLPDRLSEEVRMWQLEHGIIRGLCKQPDFDRIISQCAHDMPLNPRISRDYCVKIVKTLLPYLDEALGEQPRILEERMLLLLYCCLFMAYDLRLSPQDAQEQKERIIRKHWNK